MGSSDHPQGKLMLGSLGRPQDSSQFTKDARDSRDLPWDVVGNIYHNFYHDDYEMLSTSLNNFDQVDKKNSLKAKPSSQDETTENSGYLDLSPKGEGNQDAERLSKHHKNKPERKHSDSIKPDGERPYATLEKNDAIMQIKSKLTHHSNFRNQDLNIESRSGPAMTTGSFEEGKSIGNIFSVKERKRGQSPKERQGIKTKVNQTTSSKTVALPPLTAKESHWKAIHKKEKQIRAQRIAKDNDGKETARSPRRISNPTEDKNGGSVLHSRVSHNASSTTTPLSHHGISKGVLPTTNSRQHQKRSSVERTFKKQTSLRKLSVSGQDPKILNLQHVERKRNKDFKPLLKFRRAVRLVMLLRTAILSNRESSKLTERKLLSWTQVHDDVTSLRRAYERFGLSFDPSFFKVNREVHVSSEAKATLMLPPDIRTEEQRRVALLSLCTAVDVFSEFPVTMQKSIVKVGWYEFFESKRIIIRQGHVADNFYLILSGTAIVTILDRDINTGEVYSRTVALLKKGNSFGEIGLMRGSKRSATVTCRDDMEVLAVGRQDFINIFMHIEQNREPHHIQFLRSIDELEGWPIEQLPYDNPKVCLFTYFRRGVLLCKDSNTSDWIFIIKTGSCRVLKSLKSTKPKLPQLDLVGQLRGLDLSKSLPPLNTLNRNNCIRTKNTLPKDNNHLDPKKRKRKTPLDILDRSPSQVCREAENHLRELDDLIQRQNEMNSVSSDSSRLSPCDNDVFVEIQKLGPRDTYGLEAVLFGMLRKTTSTSLVSEGTECILINRKFFLHHLSEDVAKSLRSKIRPLPADSVLQQKLQTKTNWEAYKTLTVAQHIIYNRQIQYCLS